MGIGDGGNDLAMVANVGLGVAMANAVPEVTEALRMRCCALCMHGPRLMSFPRRLLASSTSAGPGGCGRQRCEQ